MICDLDDDISGLATTNPPTILSHTPTIISYTLRKSFVLRSNPSRHSLPFRIVIFLGNCKLKKIPTASSGITAHTSSWFSKSRVHETNVINVGWEEMLSNGWVFGGS